MDFYKIARNMYDDPEDGGGFVLGEIKLTGKVLKIIGAILALIITNHMARLFTGNIAWTGGIEVNARPIPEWQKTPFSGFSIVDGFGLSLPTPAGPGDEIVIKYNLTAPEQDETAPSARVLISCYCPATNWTHFRIDSPGEGELIMPVTDQDFYTVTLYQSAGPTGRGSVGHYYWGVRRSTQQ